MNRMLSLNSVTFLKCKEGRILVTIIKLRKSGDFII